MSDSNNNNPFNYPVGRGSEEDDPTQPLRLRKGSDAEARRSLIEKYRDDINQSHDSGELTYNMRRADVPAGATGQAIDPLNNTMAQLEEQLEQKKKRNIKIALIIGAVVIFVVTLILIISLHKGAHPHPPVPPVPPHDDTIWISNPYEITEMVELEGYSHRMYNLTRNTSLQGNYSSIYAREETGGVTAQNRHIDMATLKVSVAGSFRAMRLQFFDQNSSNQQYQVSDEFLSPEFRDLSNKNLLNYNELLRTHFELDINEAPREHANKSSFVIRGHSAETLTDGTLKRDEIITTLDQELFLMTNYQQLSFEVKSQRILGWGQRMQNEMTLKSGNYTIFPQQEGDINYDKTEYLQGPGAHPLLIFQVTGTNNYAGLYLFNSNPMQLEVYQYNKFLSKRHDWTQLTFRAAGGALDMFLFFGPTFEEVLRQYQDVFGRPKMMPLWAHGFFSKSPAYSQAQTAHEAIEGFRQAGYPLQGVYLNMDFENHYFTNTSEYIKQFRELHPSPDTTQLILPFSYFVPSESSTSWLKDKLGGYAIKADIENLLVEMTQQGTATKGWCMDPFHPDFVNSFLEPVVLRNQTTLRQGYWLHNNIPVISKYHHTFHQLWELPFRPGDAFNTTASSQGDRRFETVPEQALHTVGNNQREYHFNLHGVYGSKLTTSFIESLPAKRTYQQTPFVLSSSTFSGLGRTGAAHLLRHSDEPSYADLPRQLISMVNMGLFGMINTGVSLCSPQEQTQATNYDEELCLRYFQLSVVSPMAVFNDRSRTVNMHPFHFKNEAVKSAILRTLKQRMEWMLYQRSSLKAIEQHGGSLLRPLFTVFPSYSQAEDSVNQYLVMYGPSMLVVFARNQGQSTQKITLPLEHLWLDLNTLDTIQGGQDVIAPLGIEQGLPMYQRSGSVVPVQDPSQANSTLDLDKEKTILSIVLDSDGRAQGYVYLEDGSESDFKSEFHEVTVDQQVINFVQQDNIGQQSAGTNENDIDLIIVTNLQGDKPINTACALLKDMRTVQTLYALDYNATKKQVYISPQDPNRPGENFTELRMNNVAHVFYGHSEYNLTCTQEWFSYRVAQILWYHDDIFEARLESRLSQVMTSNLTMDQYIKVELLSNNSISMTLSDERLNATNTTWMNRVRRDTPTEIYDRNFTKVRQQNKTIRLNDVFYPELTTQPFCFNFTLPGVDQPVLFSTCGSQTVDDQGVEQDVRSQVQHMGRSVFNWEQAGERFFGLGERKGQFFLQNRTTYAMYNNDQNVLPSHQVGGRVVDHGRNGFYPIMYSQLPQEQTLGGGNLTATMFFTGHGQEITYHQNEANKAQLAMSNTGRDIEMVFIFNLNPIETVEAVHQHIQFGEIRTNRPEFVRPPPSWAFGHHVVIDSKTTFPLLDYVNQLYKQTNFPIEGYYLEEKDDDLFRKEDEAVVQQITTRLLTQQDPETEGELGFEDISLINYHVSGYPKASQDKTLQFIKDNSLQITTIDNQPYEAYDYSGRFIFVDYSLPKTKDLVELIISVYQESSYITKLGVNLFRNEISKHLCSLQNCYLSSRTYPASTWHLQKPGNQAMTVNTLPKVRYSMGSEEQLHNLYSLMEQIQYDNAANTYPIIVSTSTAMGSGKLGNVARVLDYYENNDQDIQLATMQLQSMSILGMPLVSTKIPSKIQSDKEYAKRAVIASMYQSSISVMDFYGYAQQYLNSEDLLEFNQLLRQRYVMMAYTRTQVFRQTNFGTPVVRPIFFHSQPEGLLLTTQTMYMYGPSIVGLNDDLYSLKTFPTSNYCTQHTYGQQDNTTCFTSQLGENTYDGKHVTILREGTITPLYHLNQSTSFSGARDLYNSTLEHTLNLHVFNDQNGRGVSRGELLIDNGTDVLGGGNQYCYIEMRMINDTIHFTDMSTQYGGGGQEGTLCYKYTGYELKYVYLYNFRNLTEKEGYLSGKINGQHELELIEVDQNEMVGTFQVKPNEVRTTYHLYDIKTITFSTDAPPQAAY